MTRVIAVIPARMGSSRFPGKPLATLLGRPMLEHVYRRTAACAMLDEVMIATCDDAIADVACAFGARAVMTSAAHERASERVAEACASDSADIVVMVQGDEPLISPDMIEAAIAPMLRDQTITCTNLAGWIRSEAEFHDPNTIKTVMTQDGRALYFSRTPVPWVAPHAFVGGLRLKQVCVISFRREALQSFASLPRGPLEVAESIDMLRFLENGWPVHLVVTQRVTHAVDTERDLEVVIPLLSQDSWPSGSHAESAR